MSALLFALLVLAVAWALWERRERMYAEASRRTLYVAAKRRGR
jgi:hypothetical protein